MSDERAFHSAGVGIEYTYVTVLCADQHVRFDHATLVKCFICAEGEHVVTL
jgi:hypothetical protein